MILDEAGKPVLGGDHDRRFFEASWVFKRGGKYYYTYSTGDTHFLNYATGDIPYGPFTYTGHILQPVQGWTTHHSIIEWNEQMVAVLCRHAAVATRTTCATSRSPN